MPETDALRTLTDSWSSVVGNDVAAHARLEAVRDETIAIAVDGTLWATQLRYLEADILERANTLVGARVAQRIRVRVEAEFLAEFGLEFRPAWSPFRGVLW